ncbi:subunit of the nuclear pore complex that is localized to both sides of the pore [Stylonychia lemnae]|uniref:Subunit of the nuclear pore complex that is localized to both sides of the pore n=1 Tax=Stylonychia lemnae TaxID=5949 RepID=A0A078A872_STYLE|nr:subunit of the nuclear pore complex that is localized to both sides of the pore [Stylonychia lemnae]|eukprot:CDW76976.1 subunit of the nuclear pore complex that is localized to both sides of the pore [Stylonychia lemnae]
MFGQQTTFGQTPSTSGFGAFGQPQQQPSGGGLFGGTSTPGFGGTSAFGGASTGGFGLLGQPQSNPGTSLFGGATTQTSGFGGTGGLFGQTQPSTPAFGQSQGSFGAFGGGNAPINQGAATGGFGSFSQATKSAGFGAFGQTSQSTPFGQGGAFGQSTSAFGQTSSGLGFGQTQPQQNQQQQQQQASERGFYKQIQPVQSINSWGNQFQFKNESAVEGNKGQQNQSFNSIRVEGQFNLVSGQMLRYYDLVMKNTGGQQQIPNHESLAMQELNQSGQNYKFLQQVQAGPSAMLGGLANPQGAGGLFGGGATQGFGQATSTAFGQQNQPFGGTPGFGQSAGLGGPTPFGSQPQGGLFGASTGQQSSFGKPLGQTTGGLFGQQQQQTTTPFGQTTPFGASGGGGGGLFGQPQQQQQPAGGGLFGATQSTGGGLFGQPQQQPSAGGSLFGGGQQQQTNLGGGGLFGKPAATGGLFGQPQATQSTAFGQPAGQQPSGGLFGQQQQQPAGGLFGQQQQQPAGGGGLFGQQQQQQQPGGGLFGGGASTGLGGGLFGGGQQQQQPSQTPSLFNQTSTGQPGGGGLFGGGGATQQNGGGLFGAKPAGSSLFGGAQQQPGQSSLFGGGGQQQQPAGGGLFGQQQQQQPAGGGLFGQTPSTSLFGGQQAAGGQQPSLFSKPSTGGGLFGQTTQGGSSLFGGATQTQQPSTLGTSNLFGGQSQNLYGQQQTGGLQTQMQQPQMMNPYLLMSNDPFGLGDTLSKESPFANIDAELEKLKQNQKIDNQNPYKDLQLTSSQTTKESEDLYGSAPGGDEDRERDNYNDQLMRKYKQYYQSTESDVLSQAALGYNRPGKMFNAQKGFINTPSTSFKASYTPGLSQSSVLTKRSLRPSDEYPRPESLHDRFSKQQDQEEDLLTTQKQHPVPSKDIINISVVIPDIHEGQEPDQYQIKIHLSRDVMDLYFKTEQYLKSTINFNSNDTDLMLLYRNQILKKDLSLKEAGIQQNCSIYVLTQSKFYQPKIQETKPQEYQQAAPKEDDSNQLIPKQMIPRTPKAGYQTQPEFLEIARMTLRQARNVKNFKIFNEFGSIQFDGETDITEVNLETTVAIMQGRVEVYMDDDKTTVKPEVGLKLNKPALITLYNMDILKKKTIQEKVDVYKKGCEKQGSMFISYDSNKKILVMKVQHFTKYGFDDDEESEQQDDVAFDDAQNSRQMSGQVPEGSVISQDQHINIKETYQFPNKLYSDPNHVIHPKFAQKLIAQEQAQQIDKLFTTQPKTSSIFDKQKAQIQQTSVPVYVDPMVRVEKKQDQNFSGMFKSQYESQGSSLFKTNQVKMPAPSNFTLGQQQPQMMSPPQTISENSIVPKRPVQKEEEGDAMLIDYERMSQQSQTKRRFIEDTQSYGEESMDYDKGPLIDIRKSKQRQNLRTTQALNDRKARALELRQKILDKKQEEPSLQQLFTTHEDFKVQSADETIKILADLGFTNDVRKLVKPVKMIPCRPVFTPNGSLLKVTTSNQIKQVKIPLDKKINLKQNEEAYKGVSDILIKHGSFIIDRQEPNLGQRFDSLHLQSQMPQQQLQNQLNYLIPQSFDDPFIERTLASTQVKTLEFQSDPTIIFYFLEDLAKHLIQQIDSQTLELVQKLSEEFYVICTLNALFGNPCIQLVQLHPDFKGLNNYNKARKIFGQNGLRTFEDGHTIQIEKQRRNALTEVLRFMCQQEYKLPADLRNKLDSKDHVYQIAQHHLFNGDIKSALAHLNKHGKAKMAMLVSQAMTSTSSSQYLDNHVKSNPNIYGKFKQPAKDFIQFLSGLQDTQNLGQRAQDWARWLQYYLTIKITPNNQLSRALDQYDNEVYKQYEQASPLNGHRYPLIYFLIKLYHEPAARKQNLIKNHLGEFVNIEPTSRHNVQDHRLQLITVIVLYYVQRHYKIRDDQYASKYLNFEIKESILARHAIQYAHQLLRQDDWRQALLITQIIPSPSIKIKKMMMFQILIQKANHFLHHSYMLTNFYHVERSLHVPKSLMKVARAIYYQNRFHPEQAMYDWLESDNLVQAHRLFVDKLAPLYFNLRKCSDLQISHQMRAHFNLFNETYSKMLQLDRLNGRDVRRDALYQFIAYVECASRSENPAEIETLMRNVANVLGLKPELQINNLQRYIWEYLLNADRAAKAKNLNHDLTDLMRTKTFRQSFSYRNNQSYEPMLELTNLYSDNPCLLKYFDSFATNNLTKLICNKVSLDSQVAC